MKSVRFELDKNELFYIENISEYLMHSSGFLSNLMCKINEIKEMRCCYLNNRNETLVNISLLVREIVDHKDVNGIIINLPNDMEDRFMKNLVSMFTTCFELHKKCEVYSSDKFSMVFIDGISNPSVNEFLECVPNWQDQY